QLAFGEYHERSDGFLSHQGDGIVYGCLGIHGPEIATLVLQNGSDRFRHRFHLLLVAALIFQIMRRKSSGAPAVWWSGPPAGNDGFRAGVVVLSSSKTAPERSGHAS